MYLGIHTRKELIGEAQVMGTLLSRASAERRALDIQNPRKERQQITLPITQEDKCLSTCQRKGFLTPTCTQSKEFLLQVIEPLSLKLNPPTGSLL